MLELAKEASQQIVASHKSKLSTHLFSQQRTSLPTS
jgi:hypothetical protein